MKIYIANLAKYNEGVLKGEWISLPMDQMELQSKINNILGDMKSFSFQTMKRQSKSPNMTVSQS